MDVEGLLADAGEFTGGLQQTLELLFEVFEVAHLHGARMAQEQIDERGEVFHVRAKKHRFAGEDGLGGILTAFAWWSRKRSQSEGESVAAGYACLTQLLQAFMP